MNKEWHMYGPKKQDKEKNKEGWKQKKRNKRGWSKKDRESLMKNGLKSKRRKQKYVRLRENVNKMNMRGTDQEEKQKKRKKQKNNRKEEQNFKKL